MIEVVAEGGNDQRIAYNGFLLPLSPFVPSLVLHFLYSLSDDGVLKQELIQSSLSPLITTHLHNKYRQ